MIATALVRVPLYVPSGIFRFSVSRNHKSGKQRRQVDTRLFSFEVRSIPRRKRCAETTKDKLFKIDGKLKQLGIAYFMSNSVAQCLEKFRKIELGAFSEPLSTTKQFAETRKTSHKT